MAKVRLIPPGQEKPMEIDVDRNVGDTGQTLHIRLPSAAHDVEVETTGPGRGWLRLHGRIVPFVALRRDNTVEVWVRGRRHPFKLASRTARRTIDEGVTVAGGEITAGMPGTILQIHVKPGDAFDAHQPLIVMESMKMEMTLSAPHPGCVKSVDCKVGQLVEMGAVLVRIDRDDAAPPS